MNKLLLLAVLGLSGCDLLTPPKPRIIKDVVYTGDIKSVEYRTTGALTCDKTIITLANNGIIVIDGNYPIASTKNINIVRTTEKYPSGASLQSFQVEQYK